MFQGVAALRSVPRRSITFHSNTSMKRASNTPGSGQGKKPRTPRTNQESYNEVLPEYVVEGAYRRVLPYYFEYQTYAKERWLGRSIIDVFLREFRDRPARYYREAIIHHLITINGLPCHLEQLVEPSDLIGHRLHRHEPPVTSEPIRILHHGEDGLLVVNKPASIPAHPSGRYRFNSLIEILRHDSDLKKTNNSTGDSSASLQLSLINRLDRLTSGICIMASNPTMAETLHRRMEGGDYFRKEYIARVVGQFPSSPKSTDEDSATDRTEEQPYVECKLPLKVIEHKLGLVTVDEGPQGKLSHTRFKLLAYCPTRNQSLVWCQPLTGRTHQIRVHLRSLGHPIVNDYLYNNDLWPKDTPQPNDDQLKVITRTLLEELKQEEADEYSINNTTNDNDNNTVNSAGETSLCPECQVNRPDPSEDKMCIYLHAFKYSSPDWSFEAPWPKWAHDLMVNDNSSSKDEIDNR